MNVKDFLKDYKSKNFKAKSTKIFQRQSNSISHTLNQINILTRGFNWLFCLSRIRVSIWFKKSKSFKRRSRRSWRFEKSWRLIQKDQRNTIITNDPDIRWLCYSKRPKTFSRSRRCREGFFWGQNIWSGKEKDKEINTGVTHLWTEASSSWIRSARRPIYKSLEIKWRMSKLKLIREIEGKIRENMRKARHLGYDS